MASNFVGVEPKNEVKRSYKKKSAYLMVTRSSIICSDHISLEGVDKCDFFITLYFRFSQSRKWTLPVIIKCLNTNEMQATVVESVERIH